MPTERKPVLGKKREEHPASALTSPTPTPVPHVAAVGDPVPPLVANPAFPTAAPDLPPTPEPAPTPTPVGEPQSEGAKVPVNYRLPKSLLDRLKTAARHLPSKLDRDLSQNKIVEEALDEYLRRHGH